MKTKVSFKAFLLAHTSASKFFRFSHAALALLVAGGLAAYFGVPQQSDAIIYTPLNNQRAKDFAIIRSGATWHVFAIWCDITDGCDAHRRGLMHLTSTDLKNWTEQGYILPPDGGTDFDDYDIWAPSIVEYHGTYYMYYTGVYKNGSNVLVQKVGLATSTDLTNWTKYSTSPVFDCTSLSGVYYNTADVSDGAACRDPNVIWDPTERQWVMTVSSRRTGSTPANNMSIAIATSEDLVTWQPYGFIPATDDYTAESSHIIKHGSTYYMMFTEDGSGSTWIDYLTSSNLYSGWTRIGDLSQVGQYEYASETVTDRGQDYFARVDNNNVGLDFSRITWSGTPFTLQDPPYASVGDSIWNDANGNGTLDGSEAGIDNVTVKLYLDDGDGIFNPSSDALYGTTTSGDDPNTAGTQHGYYRFTNIIPDSYWVVIDPTNYQSGGALYGYVATTTNTTSAVTLSDSDAITTLDMGFRSSGTTWPLTASSTFTVGSGGTISGGRGAPTTTADAGGATWWNQGYQYRQQLTVTANTQNLDTTKTVVLTKDLAALVTAGKLQSSYNDLRLVYWNGSTNTELNADIVDSSTVRFKVHSAITAGNSDNGYYLYYDDPQAAAPGVELANVYDYYDSFNAPDGTTYGSWTENGGSDWQIVGNRWEQKATTGGDIFSRDTSKLIDLSQDWAEEVTANIANTGATKVGGPSFLSQQPFGAEAYWAGLNASPTDKVDVWHWAWGQTAFTTPEQTGVSISTGTDYITRFEYRYNSVASRSLNIYLDNTQALATSESFAGADLNYDIWYQDTCPCNDKDAYFGLHTYQGDVTFNDIKGWQLHDGTTSAGSETALYQAATVTLEPKANQATPFTTLTRFAATTLDQGGSTKFVLSNDSGATWLYWDGSSWTTSNSSLAQANTVSDINLHASAFPTGSGSFLWRAVQSASAGQYPYLLQAGASVNHLASTPTLTSPSSGSALTSFTPTFTFSATDADGDTLQYELQVDTVNTFDSANLRTLTQASSQTGWSGQDQAAGTRYASGTTATYTPQTPLGNGTHYWRVRATDPDGTNIPTSYASSSFSAPAALVLSQPQATSTDFTTAQVQWTSTTSGTSRIDYGTTTAYGSTVSDDGDVTNHALTLANLQPQTTYHVKATTVDIYGQTTSSADLSFTTPTKYTVATPTIVRPEDGATLYHDQLSIEGFAAAGSSVFAIIDGQLDGGVRTTSSTPTAHFTYSSRTVLAPGSHTFFLIARDDSTGGISRPTHLVHFVTYPDVAPVLRRPMDHTSSSRSNLVIEGVSWRNRTIVVSVDDTVVGRVVTPNTGTPAAGFTFTTPSVSVGTHVIAVSAEGPGTYTSPKKTVTVTVTKSLVEHIVSAGDTLWGLAERYLGLGTRYPEIVRSNQDRYPSVLHKIVIIGQLLRILP